MSKFFRPMSAGLPAVFALAALVTMGTLNSTCLMAQSSTTKTVQEKEQGSDAKKSEKKGMKQSDQKMAGSQKKEEGPKQPMVISVSDDNLYFAVSPKWDAVAPKSRIVEKEFAVPDFDKLTMN